MKRNSHELRLSTADKLKRTVGAGLAASGLFLTACSNDEGLHIKYNDGTEQSVDDYLEDYERGDGAMPVDNANNDPGVVKDSENPIAKNGANLTEKQRFAATPEQYKDFDVSLRVNDQAKYIYQGFDKTAGYIEDALTDAERPFYRKPDLNIPRSQWSDQDYANYYTTATMFATGQDDKNAGKQTATVVAKPGTNTYENLWEWIDERNGVGARSIYEAVSTPLSNKELQQGTYGQIEVSEHGGRLVGLQSKHDGSVTYSVMLNYSDDQGNIISIEELVVNNLDDPRIRPLLVGNNS